MAFSGSFVDVLMSAVLSLILSWVQLFLTARQRVVTNIFEIGTAGVISFLAVSPPGLDPTCAHSCEARSRLNGVLLLRLVGVGE